MSGKPLAMPVGLPGCMPFCGGPLGKLGGIYGVGQTMGHDICNIYGLFVYNFHDILYCVTLFPFFQ